MIRSFQSWLIATGLGLALLTPGAAQTAPAVPTQAPANPAFLQYLNSSKLGIATPSVTAGGHGLGLIPEPVDLSHLMTQAGQVVTNAAKPSSYDLRSYGKVTPVKNQGSCGSCWAFATYGSLESILLPGETRDFSEDNLKNLHGFDAPACFDTSTAKAGGNGNMSMAYLARWAGPVDESADHYVESNVNTSPPGLPEQKHVQDVVIVPARSTPLNNDALKSALMTYGAVHTSMYWSDSAYRSATASYYYNGTGTATNHAVTLVGWDDTYSKNNFGVIPSGDGAFLIKNSWGTAWGQGGYFWISYYDTVYARSATSLAYVNNQAVMNYTRKYDYDPLGWVTGLGYSNSTTAWFANVFTAVATEQLRAVSFYAASDNSPYTIAIYTNVSAGPTSGTLAGGTSGTLATAGYHTVALPSPVSLVGGLKFSVVVQLNTPGYNWPVPVEYAWSGYSSGASSSPGQSYFSSSGTAWQDATTWNATANVCIKAFTGSAAASDLTVMKTHSGVFLQGQTGAAYSITASNAGTVPTSGAVTVSDLLPSGLTATGLSGTGWSCTVSSLTCSRSDVLAAGASYPAIALTVTVAANAPALVTNIAVVSGGGQTNTSNDQANDLTTINAPLAPDLTVTKTHTGSFKQGQTGAAYSITAKNSGTGPTSGAVTVSDLLPSGLTATGLSGTGWSCTVSSLTCNRSDVLAAGASYPAIALTVTVAANAPAMVTNTAVVSGGGQTNTSNDQANDSTTIVPLALPDLTVTKTHTGNFTQGQTGATYSITAKNSGTGPTSGTVTVSDLLPSGLTATGLSGTGWSCTVSSLTCSRSNALAAGASYPAIALTVTVAANAPALVTNTAVVSGGGQTNTSNDQANDPTTIVGKTATATIAGFVLKANGSGALSGVTVKLSDGQVVQTVGTGKYTFNPVPTGRSYTVTATKAGSCINQQLGGTCTTGVGNSQTNSNLPSSGWQPANFYAH